MNPTQSPGLRPRWGDAVRRAQTWRHAGRAEQSPAAHRDTSASPGAAPAGPVNALVDGGVWALVVYAVAVDLGCAAGAVSLGQVRYRVGDLGECTVWMWERLHGAGHQVPRPVLPHHQVGAAAALESLAAVLAQLAHETDPAADDPVVVTWRRVTTLATQPNDLDDGTEFPGWAMCGLWRALPALAAAVDELLVAERGGRARGEQVRLLGATGITTTGQLTAEVGVVADRAVVTAPAWPVDHGRRDLQSGPPTGYHLRFRDRATGTPGRHGIGPIPPEQLGDDTAAWTPTTPTPPGLRGAAIRLDIPLSVASIIGVAAHAELDRAAAGAADRDLANALRAAAPSTSRGRVLPRAMADTDDPQRLAAIGRLWALRDLELALAGDSTAARVAERRRRQELPEASPPATASQLTGHVANAHREREALQAAAGEPLQELVTGRPRAALLQWLDAVEYTTPPQRQALDGVRAGDTSLDAVRQLLAGEGFVEVLDDLTDHDCDHQRGVDLVAVHWEMAWLAVVHAAPAWRDPLGPLEFRTVRIYHQTRPVDPELVSYAHGAGTYGWVDGRRTAVWSGHITITATERSSAGSVRVRLAGLRAFGRPVAPWISPHPVHLDSASTDQQAVLDRLPQAVRELFGPCLTIYQPDTSAGQRPS